MLAGNNSRRFGRRRSAKCAVLMRTLAPSTRSLFAGTYYRVQWTDSTGSTETAPTNREKCSQLFGDARKLLGDLADYLKQATAQALGSARMQGPQHDCEALSCATQDTPLLAHAFGRESRATQTERSVYSDGTHTGCRWCSCTRRYLRGAWPLCMMLKVHGSQHGELHMAKTFPVES